MIVTRNTHAKQDFTCGESGANVNLYNGNLIVEYALEKIGLNTFEMGASIVFNTNYKNTDFNGKKIGFGNGWKLNLHQYSHYQ